MSDAVSFTELDSQHVELLAARTVLSMFLSGAGRGGSASDGDSGTVSGLTNSVTDVVHSNSVSLPPSLATPTS